MEAIKAHDTLTCETSTGLSLVSVKGQGIVKSVSGQVWKCCAGESLILPAEVRGPFIVEAGDAAMLYLVTPA